MLLSNNRWHLCWQWKKTIRCLLREPNLHYRKTADWDLRISEVCMTWVVCILFTIAMRYCVYLILACNHLHTPVSEEQAQTFADEWLYQIQRSQLFKQKCTALELWFRGDCALWKLKRSLEYLLQLQVFLDGQLSTSSPAPPWLQQREIIQMFQKVENWL